MTGEDVKGGVFNGFTDIKGKTEKVEYTGGLYMEFGDKGEYTFKNDTILKVDGLEIKLPVALVHAREGILDLSHVISIYLKSSDVGLIKPDKELIKMIGKGLRRLWNGESYKSLISNIDIVPLQFALKGDFKSLNELQDSVDDEINNCQIIDLHTHLLPSTHGGKFLMGIDELLNYHYLVSEYIMSGELSVEEFMGLTREMKTELIWEEVSEYLSLS